MGTVRKSKSKVSPKTAAANRRGSTYRTGRLTRKAIVDTAETVLMEHGHSQFTVQRVAERLGISPGNLNYYFPTRASLLESLILSTLARYRTQSRTITRSSDGERSADVAILLRWMMEDSATERTNRLFRQLWAIAATDPRVARAMDSFYSRSVRGHLRQLDVKASPSAEFQDLEAIVYLVQVIAEGTSVLFGTRQQSPELFQRVQSMAQRAIARLFASSASSPE